MKRMPIYKWEITSSVKHGDGKTTSVGFDIWTVRMVMACTPFIEGLGSSIQMKDRGFLHSLHSSTFKNAKNDGSLIMQGFYSSCITCRIRC